LLKAKIQLGVDNQVIDKDISILVRDSQASPCGASKAMTRIEGTIKKGGSSADSDSRAVQNMIQNLRETCFLKKPHSSPIINAGGYITELDQGFMRNIKAFVGSLLDPDALIQTAFTIDDFQKYLKNLCNLTNEWFTLAQDRSTETDIATVDSVNTAAETAENNDTDNNLQCEQRRDDKKMVMLQKPQLKLK